MKFSSFLIVVVFFVVSCNNSNRESNVIEENNKHNGNLIPETQSPVFEIKTFVEDNGFGYDIYVNNEKYIHQPNIPAINGLHVFTSEEDANKVAELMVQKMQNGMTHPTISQEELKELQIEIK